MVTGFSLVNLFNKYYCSVLPLRTRFVVLEY